LNEVIKKASDKKPDILDKKEVSMTQNEKNTMATKTSLVKTQAS